MMDSGRKEREENIRFLEKVSVLKELPLALLKQIADLLKRVSTINNFCFIYMSGLSLYFFTKEFHATGSTIIQQGDPGNKFYIIRGGSVTVLKRDETGESVMGVLDGNGRALTPCHTAFLRQCLLHPRPESQDGRVRKRGRYSSYEHGMYPSALRMHMSC